MLVVVRLGQLDEAGVEQPLAFASQKFSGPQTAWATIEREAYAVMWALNRFRDIEYGTKVTVYCDHNPLQYVRECTAKSAKLLRWALALQKFEPCCCRLVIYSRVRWLE